MSSKMRSGVLVEFSSGLAFEDIPSDVIMLAKSLVLDSLGCAIAATTLGDACPEVIDIVGGDGVDRSSIFGTSLRATAQNAAFANGALVHALNFDSYGEQVGHLGVVALAAPFAVAEALGNVSGREFLAAVVAACEVTSRIHSALKRPDAGVGPVFLAGQFLSYFGAAVGAGRVLRLDEAAMSSALGLALMQAAGSRQVVLVGDPPAKAIYGAFPNQAGVQAAFLAKGGVRADCDVFGPPAGLYSMVYGGAYDEETLTGRLGEQYLMRGAQFKPWPTSAKLHPFIEACAELFKRGVACDRISSVVAFGGADCRPWCEPVEKRRAPENSAAAANSIQFAIGKTLVHGTIVPEDFTLDGLRDARALAISARTTCRLEEKRQEAAVEVVLKDGQRARAQVEVALGHSSKPMSAEMLVRKFEECCRYAAHPLRSSDVARLAEIILDLDRIDDIAQVHAATNATPR